MTDPIASALRRAVFLDRDGVLNENTLVDGEPSSPRTIAELSIPPDVKPGLQNLRRAGFLLVCVTNQPGVRRGTHSRGEIEAIHARMMAELALDDVRVCWHDDADGCECRKPKPGLLLAAARAHRIDLGASFIVGDRWRDIEAGQAAGCRTVWLRGPHSDREPRLPADFVARDFAAAAEWILRQAAPA